jgi:hypothetical protein
MKKEVEQLAKKIEKSGKSGTVIEAQLKTSERVLRRITDGIYRQPSSALRELISNAYDADATRVVIETDAPRFDSIVIRDNGNGLTDKAIASLIQNIGGSPKRTQEGIELGIVNPEKTYLSPGGRKLIGKIGIGLFSVAQLTKEFQIITKVKGSQYRAIADVILETHSEDEVSSIDEFRAGTARIWKVKATDIDSHGTEIILRKLLKKTKEDLSSADLWLRCYPDNPDIKAQEPPKYHIGCVNKKFTDILNEFPKLPWQADDTPRDKLQKLVDSMSSSAGDVGPNPSLENTFDNYLRLLWVLSLEAPVNYIDKHPFDLDYDDKVNAFQLGGLEGKAEELDLKKGSIRKLLKLTSPERGGKTKFEVFIDGVQLLRPLKFRNLEMTSHAIKRPLIFIGKDKPDLSNIPAEIRGGELEFEGYLFWTPKVVPRNHIGVLIRINDANGTLFDETFLKYPVSEQTRLRQITAEIFVKKGLDAALNIDRESFNYAHPHFLYLAAWVHSALRQFATKHKSLAKEIRELDRAKSVESAKKVFDKLFESKLSAFASEVEDVEIEFADEIDLLAKNKRTKGVLVIDSKAVFKDINIKGKDKLDVLKKRISALIKLLWNLGVFRNMEYKEQQELINLIAWIFLFEGADDE